MEPRLFFLAEQDVRAKQYFNRSGKSAESLAIYFIRLKVIEEREKKIKQNLEEEAKSLFSAYELKTREKKWGQCVSILNTLLMKYQRTNFVQAKKDEMKKLQALAETEHAISELASVVEGDPKVLAKDKIMFSYDFNDKRLGRVG